MRISKILSVVFLCFISLTVLAKDAYNFSVTIKGYGNRKFFLGYYFGDKQYLRDSAFTDASGKMIFKGEKVLEGGIYLIATADKSLLFDFVMTEMFFSLDTDSIDIIDNMKVKGSAENDVFFMYTKYTTKAGTEANQLDKKIREVKEIKDTAQERKLIARYREVLNELNALRAKIQSEYPGYLISKVFKMMEEVKIPEPPKSSDGSIDSNFQYYYYYNHYFDNFDFSDSRISRTPVFHPKFEQYMLKLTVQMPDSINKSADFVLTRAIKGKENFKYCLYWITNHYEVSQYMGMEGVFNHMVDEYYVKGKAYWVDSNLVREMKNKADKQRYNLMGLKGKNITMPDTANKYQSLYNIDAKYTVLVFWNATCGHCKEELPKIDSAYLVLNKNYILKKQLFLDVFSVSLTDNVEDLKKFLQEKKFSWKANVHNYNNESDFRWYYDVFTTPVMYILDENKKIIAKRLPAGQILDFIQNYDRDKLSK